VAVPCSGTGTEGDVFLQLGSTFTVSFGSKTPLTFDVEEGAMSSRAMLTGSTDRNGVAVTVGVFVAVGGATVGVRVNVGVWVGVFVGVSVGVTPAATRMQAENSDVLFWGSVAVAVRYWPAGATPERAV
jgi:hypothetical protein